MEERLLKNQLKISRECLLELICFSLLQECDEERVQEQLQLLLKLQKKWVFLRLV
jgi:hypothetical protein